MKTCIKCLVEQPLDQFYRKPDTRDRLDVYCKECKRIDQREYNARLRSQVLEQYGNMCVCCGENEKVFLTIDHINNDGAAHRVEIGSKRSGGLKMYIWLRKNGYPKDNYQILCHNCNWAKSLGGCPHQKGVNALARAEHEYDVCLDE